MRRSSYVSATSVLAAVACGGVACGSAAPASPSPHTEVRLGAPERAPEASMPEPARRVDVDKAVVAVSLLTLSGDGFWGDVAPPTSAPELLVRPCYEAMLRASPKTAGWVVLELDVPHHKTKPVAASTLPAPLVSCIEASLSTLELATFLVDERVRVYVSLSPE